MSSGDQDPATVEKTVNQWKVEQTHVPERGDINLTLTHKNATETIDVTLARRILTGKLRELKADPEYTIAMSNQQMDEFQLIVTELMTNAVVHGTRLHEITIRYVANTSELHIIVVNPIVEGAIPDSRGDLPKDEHGRGLGMIRELTRGRLETNSIETEQGPLYVAYACMDVSNDRAL